MQTIRAGFQILDPIDGVAILKKLEIIGRLAHKSEDSISEDSYSSFIKMILFEKGHESVIEHASISVLFVIDRGVSHELVRHRIASYTQESTRYCDYSEGGKKGGMKFITPFYYANNSEQFSIWLSAMMRVEKSYNQLDQLKSTPQKSRSVLPNSLKTEIAVTCNLREWRHIFKLRTPKAAHPQMREVMIPLLHELKKQIPIIFDDIDCDMNWYNENVKKAFEH